jgi:hypothetical protein
MNNIERREAKALDTKIRTLGGKIDANVTALRGLLENAAQADIHVALGYSSWPAYLRDAVPTLYDPKTRTCKPLWKDTPQ